jgi:hypothetical protein
VARRPPRFQLHFTPTIASWLNLVERRFALITDQSIRRGTFQSVTAWSRRSCAGLAHWNQNAKPFICTRSAADIKHSLTNVTAIYETKH